MSGDIEVRQLATWERTPRRRLARRMLLPEFQGKSTEDLMVQLNATRGQIQRARRITNNHATTTDTEGAGA